MTRGTRSRTPGNDEQKRLLLASLNPRSFTSLVADILYFSKGHRRISIMDGPGDGCRDIQSSDKDGVLVLTQCKCFVDTNKSVGSPDANELVVALTKFGKKRGIMATTGRLTPQLKREFSDNFPNLDLDWIDGADIVDEVFSNPLLFRAWVTGDAIGRETIYVKMPFIIRRADDDTPVDVKDKNLLNGVVIEGSDVVDIGSLERFRPPESVHWSESFGRNVRCAALLSTSPPDLYDLERLHHEFLDEFFGTTPDVLTVRFGVPYLVPTKNPQLAKGMPIPGFSPRSYIVRPGKQAIPEQDFLLLTSESWSWPDYLSVAEGDWGNWQTADNQRWCHVQVSAPSFPNSTQSQICRMIGESKRRELRDTQAVFVTATHDICSRLLESCSFEPDLRCANGPGGEMLGWLLRSNTEREAKRTVILAVVAAESEVEVLDIEDAIHITARSEDPLVPAPANEVYYPAQLVWEYNELPSPHYLKGRSCTFVEFWKVPTDLVTARAGLKQITFHLPHGWDIYIDCKRGSKTKKVFPMISVSVPWPLDRSTTELIQNVEQQVDEVFGNIGTSIQAVWLDAYCATAEFWETEVRFPAGAYLVTEEGLVRSNWWPDNEKEGDD
jgi:Restriction endonuclease